MASTKGVHAGHRSRLRSRVIKYGIDSLSPHEKIEYIISHCITRKDTNTIAHNLLNTFGGVYNMLTADEKDLRSVDGIGDISVAFLKSLLDIFNWINQDKNKQKIKLTTAEQSVTHYRNIIGVKDYEEAYIAMLNDRQELIKMVNVGKGTGKSVCLDEKLMLNEINLTRPKYVVILHTHPNGSVLPSEEDKNVTVNLMCSCKMYNTMLVEHLILNKKDFYSFKSHGDIAELSIKADNKYLHLIN